MGKNFKSKANDVALIRPNCCFFNPAIILAIYFPGQNLCRWEPGITAWFYNFCSDQSIFERSFDTLNDNENTLI